MQAGLPYAKNEAKLFMSRSDEFSYNGLMKTLVPTIFAKLAVVAGLLGGTLALPSQADAASCSSRASSLAASKGGTVLSVSARGNKCVIKLLIKSSNGPPKRKTFRVSK